MKSKFVESFEEQQRAVNDLALEKGFYDEASKMPLHAAVAEKLCLIHAEISEALEDIRKTGVIPEAEQILIHASKPAGFTVELADAVIRIMDLAEWLKLPLAEAIEKKHAYNKTRAYKHGKAF